jgi:hypothetical protein
VRNVTEAKGIEDISSYHIPLSPHTTEGVFSAHTSPHPNLTPHPTNFLGCINNHRERLPAVMGVMEKKTKLFEIIFLNLIEWRPK